VVIHIPKYADQVRTSHRIRVILAAGRLPGAYAPALSHLFPAIFSAGSRFLRLGCLFDAVSA
jgi:hypothetical protein